MTTRSIPPLIPRTTSGPIPLSFAQERLWFLDQLEPGTPLYNIPFALRMTGNLDLRALENALNRIWERHEVLRATIRGEAGIPQQVIAPYAPRELPVIDLREKPPNIREEEAQRLADEEACRPFSLSEGPLFRTTLVRKTHEESILLVNLHHIISDLWSGEVFKKELGVFYNAAVKGESQPLPPLPIQYSDYAVWQREWLTGEALDTHLNAWKRQLEGASPILELPTDHPRPQILSSEGSVYEFSFPKDLLDKLKTVRRREGMTLFMTLVGAFQLLMQRYSGQDDVIVGIPHAGRAHLELEGMVGFFINTLPLRGRLVGNPSVGDYLKQVRSSALEAYHYEALPFTKLVEALHPIRDRSRNPLVQVMFQLENVPTSKQQFHGLTVEGIRLNNLSARWDLSFHLIDRNVDLLGRVVYSTALFEETSIQRMMERFQVLLEAIAEDQDQPVRSLPILPLTERRALLEQGKANTGTFPSLCTHEMFERQVQLTPDAIALVCDSTVMTYQALNRKANGLARQLQQVGVLPGDVIPVLIDRSPELVVSYLAILKAGAAFVPLDPDWPAERIKGLLAQLSSKVVLLGKDKLGSKKPTSQPTVVVNTEHLHESVENLQVPVRPQDPAYMMFTSGSTGMPKGAINHHKGFVNRLWNMQQRYPWSPQDTVLVTLRHTFDASLWQYFWPLLHGARIVLPPPTQWMDLTQIVHLIEQEQVTLTGFVPSVFTLLVDAVLRDSQVPSRLASLQHLLIGGEALKADPVNQFRSLCPHITITNTYGPTEASVSTIFHEVPDPCSDPIPLGRPLKNVSALILDEYRNLVPMGVAGELYLGGVCVGLGYLNDARATQAAFVANPFPEIPGLVLYKTGDRASLQADGTIRFLGRRDHQIKVHGVRMELGEIETALRRHQRIDNAVVEIKEDPQGQKLLVAYLVFSQLAESLPNFEIRRFLSQHLPTVMIPTVFVVLEKLPLLLNGKVDRQALPAPIFHTAEEEQEFVAPRTPTEHGLTKIWAEVLGVQAIGVNDNFFTLGGHSLLGIQVMWRTNETFKTELPVNRLFEHPTIAELAAEVSQAGERVRVQDHDPIVASSNETPLPLSFTQERFWLLDQIRPDPTLFHTFFVFQLKGSLNVQALTQSLQEIVNRHGILRTIFPVQDGTPQQVILPTQHVELPIRTPNTSDSESGLQQELRASIRRPFNLEQGPLFRAELWELAPDNHFFVWAAHHLISDAWSKALLLREFETHYEGCDSGTSFTLPALPYQYSDFSRWQRSQAEKESWQEHLKYWKTQLHTPLPGISLPTDFPRTYSQNPKGSRVTQILSEHLSQKIKYAFQEERCTPFMILLAGIALLLNRLTGDEDVMIGAPSAGRTRPEWKDLIGCLLNTLALRLDLSQRPTFRQVLRHARKVTLEAQEHEEIPFEKVLEALHIRGDLSRSPLFQVFLNMHEFADDTLSLPELNVHKYPLHPPGALFDLSLYFKERDQCIHMLWEYNESLFTRSTVERIGRYFERVLTEVIHDPDKQISEIALLDEDERQQQIHAWNETSTIFPESESLAKLLENPLDKAPDAIALIDQKETITYAQLHQRANQLAHHLTTLGVGPEVRVAIYCERSLEMMVGLLGTLKAGGGYVPIDPSYPQDRVGLMLEDAQVAVVITHGDCQASLPPHSAKVVWIDSEWPMIERYSCVPPKVSITPDNLAYMIYTSGSTGKPKGVLVPNRSLMNFLHTMIRDLSMNESTRMLAVTSLSFDIAVLELWAPLLVGGRVVLASRTMSADPSQLTQCLSQEGITAMQGTPATWQLLVSQGWPGHAGLRILCGGEQLTNELADQLLDRGQQVWNLYGPTETTVWSTSHTLVKNGHHHSSIGRPIANTQVYVEDRWNHLLPMGMAGELYIGGQGVTRGYWRLPDSTAERFVPDPYQAQPGMRRYKTGDVVRTTSEGYLEWLARRDHQVKLRGHRIELGEIEAALRQHPDIEETVVTCAGRNLVENNWWPISFPRENALSIRRTFRNF